MAVWACFQRNSGGCRRVIDRGFFSLIVAFSSGLEDPARAFSVADSSVPPRYGRRLRRIAALDGFAAARQLCAAPTTRADGRFLCARTGFPEEDFLGAPLKPRPSVALR